MVEFQPPTIDRRHVAVLAVILLLVAVYGFVMRASPLQLVVLSLIVAAALYVLEGLFGPGRR